MINDPAARDFSTVRTPILSFLVAHEIFRAELNAKFGTYTSMRGKNVNPTKAADTRRAKRHALWAGIFSQLGGRAGTTSLANTVERAPMSVHSTMQLLESERMVVRDGVIKHPGNGRDQIIWKWVG